MFSLKGKTAIVTGATGLIGRHHCIALAEAGATVIVADLCEEKAKEFGTTLLNNSIGIGLDISNSDSIYYLREEVLSKFGKIDILVNNAAINDMFEDPLSTLEQSKFENYPLDMWNKSIEVNLTGTFLCCKILGSKMAEAGRGSIINIASTYGITAPDQSIYIDENGEQMFYKSPSYPVTKAGVISLTKYLAAYWGNKNVRVNCLSPGGVENNQQQYFINNYSKKTPLKRMAKPDDYRGAIVFLASDESSYMTGANLVVDGGWTAW